MNSFGEVRVDALKKRIQAGDALYEQGSFEPARAEFYAVSSELELAKKNPEFPEPLRAWAGDTLPDVDAKLQKAVRAKEYPNIVGYFKEWPKRKRELRKAVKKLGSREGHQKLIIQLALPGVYAKHLDDMTSAERDMVPARYRSKSFIRGVRRDLDQLERQANKELAYVVSCGDRPVHSPFDGGSFEAERLVKRSAHDPDSVDVENCTEPQLTMRKCWQFTCDVRGKNMFGARILNRMTFRQDATTISTR